MDATSTGAHPLPATDGKETEGKQRCILGRVTAELAETAEDGCGEPAAAAACSSCHLDWGASGSQPRQSSHPLAHSNIHLTA